MLFHNLYIVFYFADSMENRHSVSIHFMQAVQYSDMSWDDCALVRWCSSVDVYLLLSTFEGQIWGNPFVYIFTNQAFNPLLIEWSLLGVWDIPWAGMVISPTCKKSFYSLLALFSSTGRAGGVTPRVASKLRPCKKFWRQFLIAEYKAGS